LTLDIFTSSVLYDARAPVVVFVPGDREDLLPSSTLAKEQGVVFVVVNVRQGVLGFLSHALLSGSERRLENLIEIYG
jgi:carboxylesterase type B